MVVRAGSSRGESDREMIDAATKWMKLGNKLKKKNKKLVEISRKKSMKWLNLASTHKNACNLLNAIYLFDECMSFAYNDFRSIQRRPSHENNSPFTGTQFARKVHNKNYSILWMSKRIKLLPIQCALAAHNYKILFDANATRPITIFINLIWKWIFLRTIIPGS